MAAAPQRTSQLIERAALEEIRSCMATVEADSRVGVPGRKQVVMVGGIFALLIRSELAFPGQQIVKDELYNQAFTMHGTIMLLLFAPQVVRFF